VLPLEPSHKQFLANLRNRDHLLGRTAVHVTVTEHDNCHRVLATHASCPLRKLNVNHWSSHSGARGTPGVSVLGVPDELQ